MFELTDVTKTYGGGAGAVDALRGVDLRVDDGEMVVVAGPSGSGKTTMLQLLGGLDRASTGRVAYGGVDMGSMGDGELSEMRLKTFGFVFQQFNLIPTLTASENVQVPMAPTGADSAQRAARSSELLAAVGLADRHDHLPGELSGGEQQRVAIARALANRPQVLLADEPTGNLDSGTGAEVLALLRQLNAEEGRAVVLITHDPSIAEESPRVVRLQDGRVVEDVRQGGAAAPEAPTGPGEALATLESIVAVVPAAGWGSLLPAPAAASAGAALTTLADLLPEPARAALGEPADLTYGHVALAVAALSPRMRPAQD